MQNYILSILIFFTASLSIQAQELSTFSGFLKYDYYQDSKEISKQEFLSLIHSEPESSALWKQSNKHLAFSWAGVGVELLSGIWLINSIDKGKDTSFAWIGFLGGAVAGLGYSFSAVNLRKRSILAYNRTHDISYFNIGVTNNGLGISYNF